LTGIPVKSPRLRRHWSNGLASRGVRGVSHLGWEDAGMAFGQQSGPPATAKQVQYLESLVRKAGHDGFRDARGPLGLTQRQAGGRFTRDEASTLIDLLLQGDPEHEVIGGRPGPSMEEHRAEQQLEVQRIQVLQGMPADLLADELRRRGWSVAEPG
jgi:hypothetical protein